MVPLFSLVGGSLLLPTLGCTPGNGVEPTDEAMEGVEFINGERVDQHLGGDRDCSDRAGHQASSHQVDVNGAWQSVSRFTSIGHQRANPASDPAIGSTGSRAVGPNGSDPPRAS